MQASKGDGLPERVCVPCISELNRACAFKKKCEQSDYTLRAYLDKLSPSETTKRLPLIQEVTNGMNEPTLDEEPDRKEVIIFVEEFPPLNPTNNDEEIAEEDDQLGDQIYHCSVCLTGFESNTQLKQHYLDVHAAIQCKEEIIDEQISNSDDECDTFEDMNNINEDDGTIKSEGHDEDQLDSPPKKSSTGKMKSRTRSEETFQCDICQRSYIEKRSLFKHIMERHAAPPEFSCYNCKMIFADRNQYWDHVKSIHPTATHVMHHNKRKAFDCLHCEQSFTNKRNRDDHQR